MGAGNRENRIDGRCEVDQLGRYCGATNPSAMMSGLWLSVRSLSALTCSGVSMERVLRVQMRRFAGWVGPGLG